MPVASAAMTGASVATGAIRTHAATGRVVETATTTDPRAVTAPTATEATAETETTASRAAAVVVAVAHVTHATVAVTVASAAGVTVAAHPRRSRRLRSNRVRPHPTWRALSAFCNARAV